MKIYEFRSDINVYEDVFGLFSVDEREVNE